MQTVSLVEFVLSCSSWHEAQRIAQRLLKRQIITKAEFLSAAPKYFMQESGAEGDVKLIMESAEHLFEDVRSEIASLRKHDNFELHIIPVVDWSRK